MIQIIPAILERHWEEVKSKLELVSGLTPFVQLDVADGIFTPTKMWNNPMDLKIHLEAVRHPPIRAEADPSGSTQFEIDMMVENPKEDVESWIDAGAKRLVIHIESIKKDVDLERIINTAKDKNIEVGIALNIDTPNEVLSKWIPKIDYVQFMGIKKIGYQGQKFTEEVLHKIKSLREGHKNVTIQVDGGVNKRNAELLASAGANRLAVGSAVGEFI